MEVAHSDDHVTHAVIGGSDKIDFKMSDDGFFMQMLSASLYKDQRMAVVRETLCNADDAHKENGVTRPFEVTLTSEKLIIRDFGPGIPHDMIGPIYATYGKSTKKDNNESTGGFGLGCKSPFAYTDNFQVTSYCNGTKTVYRMSKSDSEVGGKPSIVKIVSVPTTETGLEVNINLVNERDVRSFMQRVVKVLANGEMNALLNGKQATVLPFSKMEHGYMLTTDDPLLEHSPVLVRYGAVIYPIPEHEEYASEYNRTCRLIREAEGANHDFSLILQAPPGSLSLTPSRESLTITPTTTETVKGILNDFCEGFHLSFRDDSKEAYMKAIDKMGEAKDTDALLAHPGDPRNYNSYVDIPQDEEGVTYLLNSKDVAAWHTVQDYPGKQLHAFQVADMRKRVTHLINNGNHTLDKGLLQGFRRALKVGNKPYIQSKMRAAVASHWKRKVVAPLMLEMKKKKYKHTTKDNIFALVNQRTSWAVSHYWADRQNVVPALHYNGESFATYMYMQRRVIVLCHDESNVDFNLRSNRQFLKLTEHNDYSGFLVYQVSRVQKKLEEARAFCEAMSKKYEIIDLTQKIEYREPKKRLVKIDPDKVKQSGFAQLAGVRTSEDKFDWTLITQTPFRVEKPDTYADLYGKSSHISQKRVVGIKNESSMPIISNLYGDRIAAVMNNAQVKKIQDAGLTPIWEWVPKQIIKDLSEDTKLIRALPGTWGVLSKWVTNNKQDLSLAFLQLILSNEQISTALKLPKLSPIPDSSVALYEGFRALRKEFNELKASTYTEVEGLNSVIVKISKMEPNAKLIKVAESLEGNKLLDMVDVKQLQLLFEGTDETLKTKAIKLIKTILKG